MPWGGEHSDSAELCVLSVVTSILARVLMAESQSQFSGSECCLPLPHLCLYTLETYKHRQEYDPPPPPEQTFIGVGIVISSNHCRHIALLRNGDMLIAWAEVLNLEERVLVME